MISGLIALLIGIQVADTADVLHCNKQNRNSFLWRINKPNPSYIFGTLHVPYDRIWDELADNVKLGFVNSTDFYLELDTSQPGTIAGIYQQQLLPGNQTIDKVLPPELHHRLVLYIEKLRPLLRKWLRKTAGLLGGFYVDQIVENLLRNWERKKPVWVLSLLNSLTEDQVEVGSKPLLDNFLKNAALSLNKEVYEIETVEDQMGPYNTLSATEVEFALTTQLSILETYVLSERQLPREWNILDVYLCGDFTELVQNEGYLINNVCRLNMTETELGNLTSLRQRLTDLIGRQRNKKMARKISKLIMTQQNQTQFFAIGSGHLTGDNSVAYYLSQCGHGIELIHCSDQIIGGPIPENLIELGDPDAKPNIIDFLKYKDLFEEDNEEGVYTSDFHSTLSTQDEPTDHTSPSASHSPSVVETTTFSSSSFKGNITLLTVLLGFLATLLN